MSMLDEVIKQIGTCFQSPIETRKQPWLVCVCDECLGHGKREYTLDGENFRDQSCQKCNGTGEIRYTAGSEVTLTGSNDR